jgi:hypothetical protein
MIFHTRCAYALVVALLSACAAKPPVPDWQIEAQSASGRAVKAYLEGERRVAQVEWAKAQREVAATGQPAQMARLALLECAAQTAALELTECPRYNRYAQAAAPAEQAYARYLQAQHGAADVALLPAAQQGVALQLLAQAQVVLPQAEPLSRLTAAGVALRAGVIDRQGVEQAMDTASAQGWRRAVMAWALVAQRMAQAAGDTAAVNALALRLQVLLEHEAVLPIKK